MNQATTSPAQVQAPRRVGRWVTVSVILVVAAVLTWRGYGFYRLGLAARPGHPDYRTLNPAGALGHGYGIFGTGLIFTNLLYLVRRRFAKHLSDRFGSMSSWLNAHAFTGLSGSLLVLFHSAFQLRTPIATLTSASLGIVVATGIVGFYLHALLPKAGLKPLRDRLGELRALLPGLVSGVEKCVREAPVTALPHDASFVRTVFTIPRWVIEARSRRRVVKRAARSDKLLRVVRRTDARLAKAFADELAQLAAKEVDTHAGAAMMRSWRSLHRFLAILMIVSVSLHVGVAWYYGFRWIFDR
ncbi:MAG TPA: hypothetical protein VKU41_32730 [Polyangiaceae bacterium]|nr:hypothetical protein [Polyangiaceae bacterium]